MIRADRFWSDSLRDEFRRTKPSTLSVWYLGRAGLFIQSPDAVLMIDPYFGGSPDIDTLRMMAVPLDPACIERCDAVLSTHSHIDHCHEASIKPILTRCGSKLLGAASSIRIAGNWGLDKDALIVLPPGAEYNVGDVCVRSVPARDPLEREAVAFVIEWHGYRLFHSGDAHPSPEFESLGLEQPIDVAFLNFGGGCDHWYMDAEEVMATAEALRAKTIIPIHWDAWKRSLPTLDEVVKLQSAPSADVRFMVMGDRFTLTCA